MRHGDDNRNLHDVVLLGQREEEFGETTVQISLYNDAHAHAHVFELLQRGEGDDAGAAFEARIPTDGEPARVYIEHRIFAGEPVLVCVTQQAFPHEVAATVYDPKSHQELHIEARDDAILPLVARSIRDRFGDAATQLMRFGSLGPQGSSDLYRKVDVGREIFPPDFVERALQNHVPVLNVNFSRLAHEVPSELVLSRELLFSCTRYVVDASKRNAFLETGVSDDVERDAELNSSPLVRLSLTKKSYCEDFTFSIEDARAEAGDSHMLHVRDKLSVKPLGFYAEVHQVGELRLIVMFLDDCAPRALRIAVLEPSSGWTFQIIVADAAAPSSSTKGLIGDGVPSCLEAHIASSAQRLEVLELFTRRCCTRHGLAAPRAQSLSAQGVVSPQLRPLALTTEPQHPEKHARLLALKPAQPQQRRPAVEAPLPRANPSVCVLARETRFQPNDDIVLVTLSYEFVSVGVFRLNVIASLPSSSKETSQLLVNPGLDRVLSACNLPREADLDATSFDEPSRHAFAKMLFPMIEILPTLEIVFRLEALPSQSTAPPGDSLLECDPDKLLGRIERTWSSAQPIADGEDMTASIRVEVFDGSDCREALFHSTNLRLRLTDLESGRVTTRDVHEEELEPWLEAVGLAHLLCASREPDLVDVVLRHVTLPEPGQEAANGGVVFEAVREECAGGRFGAGFFESTEAEVGSATFSIGVKNKEASSSDAKGAKGKD